VACKKGQPGNPCCGTCILLSKTFAAAGDVDSFTISDASHVYYNNGKLEMDAADQSAVTKLNHDQTPYPPSAKVTVSGDDGSVARLWISYDPTEQYGLAAELTFEANCAELRMYQLDPGGETLIAGPFGVPGAGAGESVLLHACYHPEEADFVVYINRAAAGVGYTRYVEVSGHVDQTKAAMATGSGHTGTATFDDFIWERLYYDTESGAYGYEETERTWCESCASSLCKFFRLSSAVSCDWEGNEEDWSWDDENGWMETEAADSVIWARTTVPETAAWFEDMPGWDNDRYFQIYGVFRANSGQRTFSVYFNADETHTNYNTLQITIGYGENEECGKLQLLDQDGSAVSQEHIVYGLKSGTWVEFAIAYDEGYIWALVGNAGTGSTPAPAFVAGGPRHRVSNDPDNPVTYNGGHVGIGVDDASGYYYQYGIEEAGLVEVSSFDMYQSEACAEFSAQCDQVRDPSDDDEDALDGWGSVDTDLPCNWTTDDGTEPEIVADDGASGVLDTDQVWCEATDPCVIRNLAPVPTDTEDDYVLTGSIEWYDTDTYEFTDLVDAVGFVFGSDGTDYYELRVTNNRLTNLDPGGPRTYDLELIQVEGGVETVLETAAQFQDFGVPSASVTAWVDSSMRLCWNNGTVTANIGAMQKQTAGDTLSRGIVSYGGLTAYGNYVGWAVRTVTERVRLGPLGVYGGTYDGYDEDNPCAFCMSECDDCENSQSPSILLLNCGTGWKSKQTYPPTEDCPLCASFLDETEIYLPWYDGPNIYNMPAGYRFGPASCRWQKIETNPFSRTDCTVCNAVLGLSVCGPDAQVFFRKKGDFPATWPLDSVIGTKWAVILMLTTARNSLTSPDPANYFAAVLDAESTDAIDCFAELANIELTFQQNGSSTCLGEDVTGIALSIP